MQFQKSHLQQHLAGHGSPLVRAVVAAGILVDLVLSVPGDRGLERRWHNQHGHGAALCPTCRAQRPPRATTTSLLNRSPPVPNERDWTKVGIKAEPLDVANSMSKVPPDKPGAVDNNFNPFHELFS
jgi:hypothetical protein